MVDANLKRTFGGVVVGVVMLLVAFNVSGTTVDVQAFTTADTLEDDDDSLTNIQFNADGEALLTDTSTSGSYFSLIHPVENATEAQVYVENLTANNSLELDVKLYNSTSSTPVEEKFGITLENGQNTVDLVDVANGNDFSEVELDYTYSRDTASDSSPVLQDYEIYQEGNTPYLKYVVAILGIAVLLFTLRM